MKALEILKEMEYRAKLERHGPGEEWFARSLLTKWKDKKANDLTKCVKAYIQMVGGQAERISTTGRPIDQRRTYTDVLGGTRQIGSMKWIPGTVTKGSADVSATFRGASIKIEVKVGKDHQSDAQKKYQRDVEAAGGVYYIARDFQSFFDWFNEKFGIDEKTLLG